MVSINTISSSVYGGGIAKTNHYYVFIPLVWLNSGLNTAGGVASTIVGAFEALETANLGFRCEATELPGKGIQTLQRVTYGPPREMPYGVAYQPVTMSFVCTRPMTERLIFDDWQARIADPYSHYFEYYDNYVKPIFIIQLDDNQSPTYFIMLDEAYPKTVSTQNMSYADGNAYNKVTVVFAYRKWYNILQLAMSIFGSSSGINNSAASGLPSLQIPGITVGNSPDLIGTLGSASSNVTLGDIQNGIVGALTSLGNFISKS